MSVNVVAIVQARVGSTRLPAKVLLDLGGATALQRCLDRVRRIEGVREVIVATTTNPEDDLIVSVCHRLGVRSTRGSAEDVLLRYVEAGRSSKAEAIVRCTSDCPLLDPTQASRVVQAFVASQATQEPLDYAANCLERRLPRGLDTEIVSMSALERSHESATAQPDREHVTRFIYTNAARFRLRAVLPEFTDDLSHHRWTLDTLDDYRLLAAIYDRLGASAPTASLAEVLELFRVDPALRDINAHVEQKKVAS
jgi:spore coat polysaccharide biosynthesis protein SpsF